MRDSGSDSLLVELIQAVSRLRLKGDAKKGDAPGTDKAILWNLLSHVSWRDGRGARTSLATMASECCLSKSTVKRGLARLVEVHKVVKLQEKATPRKPAVYALDLAALSKVRQIAESVKGSHGATSQGSHHATPDVAEGSHGAQQGAHGECSGGVTVNPDLPSDLPLGTRRADARDFSEARKDLKGDWFEECKQVHGGACGLSQYAHGIQMDMDAVRRRA